MSKHIIIIGAGVSGLTAGIYAKRSGFEVDILEQHRIPGGMCTSWRRKGYLFEGAIHWLIGSSDKTALNELWREVGALNETVKIRYDEPFKSMQYKGETVCLYRDHEKLREHFNLLSPEDKNATNRLIRDAKAFSNMKIPIVDIKGVKTAHPRKLSIRAIIKMLSIVPKVSRIGKMSAGDYADQFKHPALRLLLKNIIPESHSAASLLFTLAWLGSGDGGYPEGGSLELIQRMADTFISLGGKLQLSTKADKVLVENGTAVGVSVNGQVLSADAIIITQETLAAAEQLFDTPQQDKWLAALKNNTKPAACCFISIGIRVILKETPMFTIQEPIHCGGFSYSVLDFNNYSDYSGYAPNGCTTLTVFLLGDSYDFWKKARDEGNYKKEKQAVAEQVINALCQKYPQVTGKIDAADVATPLTYEHYTGAGKGSWMSVMAKGNITFPDYPCKLEHTDGVFFAGHRTMGIGGMPAALLTGRKAVQMVCSQFDTIFNHLDSE